MKDESPNNPDVEVRTTDTKGLQCGRSDADWHKILAAAAKFAAAADAEMDRLNNYSRGHSFGCPICLLTMLEQMINGILLKAGKDLPEPMIIQLVAMQAITQHLFVFIKKVPEYRHAEPSRN
jgi:predicted alpha/beta hydrolase family esterase